MPSKVYERLICEELLLVFYKQWKGEYLHYIVIVLYSSVEQMYACGLSPYGPIYKRKKKKQFYEVLDPQISGIGLK